MLHPLEHLRLALGNLSQIALGRLVGCSEYMISVAESGKLQGGKKLLYGLHSRLGMPLELARSMADGSASAGQVQDAIALAKTAMQAASKAGVP